MTYIVTALDAEAKALIHHYRLTRDYTLPYTLYWGDDILLLVTQIGKTNALMSLSALLGWRSPSPEDILINVGICAAPEAFAIGEALLIHKVTEKTKTYFPDIVYTHTLQEAAIECVDIPQALPSTHPVDMESSAIFQAASRFMKCHQIAFLKIVSDHFDPTSVTKEGVQAMILSHIPTFETLRLSMLHNSKRPILFNAQQRRQIEILQHTFTKSQANTLEDAFTYFRLKYPNKELPSFEPPTQTNKRERNEIYEKILHVLYNA